MEVHNPSMNLWLSVVQSKPLNHKFILKINKINSIELISSIADC